MKTLLLSKMRAGALVNRRQFRNIKPFQIIDRVQMAKIAGIREHSPQMMIYHEKKEACPPVVSATFVQVQPLLVLPTFSEMAETIGLAKQQMYGVIPDDKPRLRLLLPLAMNVKGATSVWALDFPVNKFRALRYVQELQRLFLYKGFARARWQLNIRHLDGIKILVVSVQIFPKVISPTFCQVA